MTPFVNGRETKGDAVNILVNIRSLHRKTKVRPMKSKGDASGAAPF
jgi:hypothetical protein